VKDDWRVRVDLPDAGGFLAGVLAGFPGRGQWITLAGAQYPQQPGAGPGA